MWGEKSVYNIDEKSLFSAKAKAGLCSHAYIVDGADGIGKLDFALYCARAMLCQGDNKPCGFCPSCQKALSGNHPDIFVIGNDKAASINDVRELIRRASLKPNDSDKQIFIVANGGKLRNEGQNALLKLFEEPPETVAVFILTDNRSSLLPTVLSRGQRIHLDGLRDYEIRDELKEKFSDALNSELEYAVDFSNGNLGEAEKYLSKESVQLRKKAQNLLLLCFGKNAYELSAALLLPKFKREQLQALLSEYILLINEVLKQKYGVKRNAAPIVYETEQKLGNASKRALTAMAEYASRSCMSLENNGNVTAVASKLAVDLMTAATR